MSVRRIHLAAPGGGAACGAHSLGAPAGNRAVLASHLLALVDCRACARTDQYKNILNPPRQYKLRLFQTFANTEPPARMGVADISANLAYHRVEVTLDGALQPDFVAYDVAAGWVERYRRVDGECQLAGGKFATERVAGTVAVGWRRAA
jgi:hypothetical protein